MQVLAKAEKSTLFRSISSGVYVLEKEANQKDSMEHLRKDGFRPLTYEEALIKISSDENLRKQLEGKWFYIKGRGCTGSGPYKFTIINGKVNLGKSEKGRDGIDETVHLWKGKQPLSFYVLNEETANSEKCRFVIHAYGKPNSLAPLVVGVPIEEEAARINEVETLRD